MLVLAGLSAGCDERLPDQRALLRLADRPAGEMEKFKPYGVPDGPILAGLIGAIRARMGVE